MEEHSKILVVDDEESNIKLVEFMLREDHQVLRSLNTHDAREVLKNEDIELILLDLCLPEEDGLSFCRELKKSENLKEIPVIFLTGFDDIQNLVDGFSAGGVDFISKPYRKEELQARVRNHVELFRIRRELRIQKDKIQQINLSRDKLYSVIAHDIRTPFTNISMLISLMDEGYLEPGTDDFKEVITNLRESTKDAYYLIDNLLHWTRSQTGTMNCSPSVIPVASLLEQMIYLVGVSMSHKNISIEQNIDTNLYINADIQMMTSVFRNILSNAIKYTPRNGAIHVSAGEAGKDVMIKIRDTGMGIEPERLSQLFASASHFTTLGTEGERGSGLGLKLVDDFVRKNGGITRVESTPGVGTTFSIVLPAANEE
jgi:two-component system, sensor histidine kinase and response regulator